MFFKKYGYAWITIAFFLGSLALHWFFGWKAYLGDAAAHGQPPQFDEYFAQMMRDTFENWQSEFLQLIWQVVGLAYFLYVGSPSSREATDRVEAKVMQNCCGRTSSMQSCLASDPSAKLEAHDFDRPARLA